MDLESPNVEIKTRAVDQRVQNLIQHVAFPISMADGIGKTIICQRMDLFEVQDPESYDWYLVDTNGNVVFKK